MNGDKVSKFPETYCIRMTRPWTSVRLLCGMVPATLYHFVHMPYRKEIPKEGYSELRGGLKINGIRALYDTMYDHLFASYRELTGHKLVSQSGMMFNLLMNLTSRLDDYLEQQVTEIGELTVSGAIESPELRAPIAFFRQFLDRFGRADVVMNYLRQLFDSYYEPYVSTLRHAMRTMEYSDILEAAEVDTGNWMGYTMQLVALFNGHEVHPALFSNFRCFAMVAKFGDDLLDLRRDVRGVRPNLVYSMLRDESRELQCLQEAMVQGRRRLGATWWRTHCPRTFARFFDELERYYLQMESRELRKTSDLILVPSLFGIDLVDVVGKKGEVAQ